MRWGGGTGTQSPAAASSRGSQLSREARAQIESSTRDRARICKYRHIYKRKGSPERRTNARCAGTSPVRFLRRPIEKCRISFVSITRCGCVVRNAAAARLPPSSHRHCWYIYRLIIELVCVTIMKQLSEWQALAESARRYRV